MIPNAPENKARKGPLAGRAPLAAPPHLSSSLEDIDRQIAEVDRALSGEAGPSAPSPPRPLGMGQCPKCRVTGPLFAEMRDGQRHARVEGCACNATRRGFR